MSTAPDPIRLSAAKARALMTSHLGLDSIRLASGKPGARALLSKLRCIQLDPLDTIGTNADLVAMARVDGLKKSDIYDALLPTHAFEHWAKERCLLPASAFPWYRDRMLESSWWRMHDRLKELPNSVVQAVLEEITRQGPATSKELSSHGSVKPVDWSGWKGTSSATTMALEVLWARCDVVVCGRAGRGKRYDVPQRALPTTYDKTVALGDEAFLSWMLNERVEACGLMSRAKGPQWGLLGQAHASSLPDDLCKAGTLVPIIVEGSSRKYLAPKTFLDQTSNAHDGRMRILAPLDPVIWDRKLVAQIFDFEYIWEVYKPASKRRWGYYVCPLLHIGDIVGRLEGKVKGDRLHIDTIWQEDGKAIDLEALDSALERHAENLGLQGYHRPKRLK